MNSGRYVLSQVLDLVHWQTLARLVERHGAESRVRHFGCRQQLICMAFAQLTWREGLRDIATCLNAKPEALYHLGFREPVAKSTLADANEQRDWRLWEDLARGLMRKARILYAGEDLGLELENTVYALDSTTIDLSLTLFPWADFRRTKAGIKMAPIAKVVATLEPDTAAKIMQVSTQVMGKPPCTPPTILLANSTKRREMPPVSIKLPARIKNGIAANGNLFNELNISLTEMSILTLPICIPRIAAKPIETATDTVSRKHSNIVISMVKLIAHSPIHYAVDQGNFQ
jgi:hypothetical protein